MEPYVFWVCAGIILCIVEFVVPGVILVSLGLASLQVGGLVFSGLLEDTAWELCFFAVFSILNFILLKKLVPSLFGKEKGDEGVSDKGAAGIIGDKVLVSGDFVDGYGAVYYRGARWQATSEEELKDGQHAEIQEPNGIVLSVRSFK